MKWILLSVILVLGLLAHAYSQDFEGIKFHQVSLIFLNIYIFLNHELII